MKLHADAKLGPKGRLLICRRVLEQGWSLAEAAEAYRSTAHALACRTLGLRHIPTRPYRPQTRAAHPHDVAGSGHTRSPTAHHRRGRPPSPVGSSATTSSDDMARRRDGSDGTRTRDLRRDRPAL